MQNLSSAKGKWIQNLKRSLEPLGLYLKDCCLFGDCYGKKIALVTNALDYVGPPAVKALLERGYDVVAHDPAFQDANQQKDYRAAAMLNAFFSIFGGASNRIRLMLEIP